MKSAVEVISTISRILREKGTAAFYMDELFPTLSKLVWPNLTDSDNEHEFCTGQRTRKNKDVSEHEELSSKRQTYYGYDMRRDLDSALGKVHHEVQVVVDHLMVNLEERFADFLNDPIFHAAAVFLDAKNYRFKTSQDIFQGSSEVLRKHFAQVLDANSCDVRKLHQEFNCLYLHVTTFMTGSTNEQIWQHLFASRGSDLPISNILHIAEICMVLPVSSAEVERVFSSFAKTLSKERLSLNNDTLETLMIIRNNDFDGYNPMRYSKVISDFLQYHPDGTVRKRAPQVTGHKTHKRKRNIKKKTKRNCLFLADSLKEQFPSTSTDDLDDVDDSDSDSSSSYLEEASSEESSSSSESDSDTD